MGIRLTAERGRLFSLQVGMKRVFDGKNLYSFSRRLTLDLWPMMELRLYPYLVEAQTEKDQLLKTMGEFVLWTSMVFQDFNVAYGIQRNVEVVGFQRDGGAQVEMEDQAYSSRAIRCPSEVKWYCHIWLKFFAKLFLDIYRRMQTLEERRQAEAAELSRSFLIALDQPQFAFLLI